MIEEKWKKSAILLRSDGWFSHAQSQIEMKLTAGSLYLLQTDEYCISSTSWHDCRENYDALNRLQSA